MADNSSYYPKRRKLQSNDEDDNSSENPDNNDVEEDRLSSLPDIILIEILSLLPLESAAATSVLSERWRHLWTQLSHLFLDGNYLPWHLLRQDSNTEENTIIRFITILNHILNQITSPHIQTFNLCIPSVSEKSKPFQSTLKSSFRFIATRNVATIKVISESYDFTYVPSYIFKIPSLVQLQLGGKFRCKLPKIKNESVSLPNLKKLELGYIIWDDLQKLWPIINNCCPILEFLSIKLSECSDPKFVNITSPRLKSLILKDIHTPEVKFVIDTPMLEHLSLDDYFGKYNFVKYPSKLIKAELWVLGIYRKHMPVLKYLLQSISAVQCIRLDDPMSFFGALNDSNVDVGSLLPNVTHLSLNRLNSGCFIGERFGFRDSIPLCLLSKLKSLEITNMLRIADNLNLVAYILSKPNVLEWLYVSTDDDEDCDEEHHKGKHLWWEYKMYNAFLAVPKSSLPTNLEFNGGFIRVSTDSSQNGLLVTFKN